MNLHVNEKSIFMFQKKDISEKPMHIYLNYYFQLVNSHLFNLIKYFYLHGFLFIGFSYLGNTSRIYTK